jgi:putative oxidoreductase
MHRITTVFGALAGLAERVGGAFAWLSPALARVTVGLVFFWSGWGKLHGLEQVTDYFTQLGLAAPGFQARLASSTEFVCGGLLLVGFLTRFAAVPLIVTMMVAIRTALWEEVTSLTSLVGLLEFSYIALLVWLATSGPGPLSADELIARAMRRGANARAPKGSTSAVAA